MCDRARNGRAALPSRLRARCLALAGAALLAAGVTSAEEPRVDAIHYDTPGQVPTLARTWGIEKPTVIQIGDGGIVPRRIEIEVGQPIAWRSRSRHLTRVTFEREVAREMICHSVVNFHLDDDQLRSAPLATGDQASFCQLKPGTYRYRVEHEATAGARQMSNRLEGVIVVRARQTAAN